MPLAPPQRFASGPDCASPLTVAVLDPLLACVGLGLAAKRALACVNRECHTVVTPHLLCASLHVNCLDCTLANARFVIDCLMPKVPGLLLCACGETFAPRMNLNETTTLAYLKVRGAKREMGLTASFFLGHALAQTNCVVRLTTGKQKLLKALREKERVYLSSEDTYNQVDQHLMFPARMANAGAARAAAAAAARAAARAAAARAARAWAIVRGGVRKAGRAS